MKYDIFLIDADNTLFNYDLAEAVALRETFAAFGIAFDEKIAARYRQINKNMWALFDEGKLGKDVLITQRFLELFAEFKITCDVQAFSYEYVLSLGRGTQLIENAFDVCKALFENGKKIYIVTNGVAITQKSRIELSAIKPFVSGMFVSEDIGFQKPDKRYFDYVLKHIGQTSGQTSGKINEQINEQTSEQIKGQTNEQTSGQIKGQTNEQTSGQINEQTNEQTGGQKILIVGDSPLTDILGGINAGLDTCWYNPNRKPKTDGVKPKYEITSLTEILSL